MATISKEGYEPCAELRRLEKVEENVDSVKEDLASIKRTLKAIDDELHLELGKLSNQFSEFAIAIERIIIRSEERDKRNSEIFIANKATFERFAGDIKAVEKELHSHSKMDVEHSNKISSLEKITYGSISALGMIIAWLVQDVIQH